jgi:glyoxylase-like metal-dependent hydrolase (beta-lactamase superfamily II)
VFSRKTEIGEEEMSQFNWTPLVQPALAREIAPGIIVIPDQNIDLVPNIGIVMGTDAVLVVDCGMGRINGERVLSFALEVAGSRPLLLTTTHFHPEHAFGAQAFNGHATFIANTTQADELREKGPFFLNVFRDLGPEVRELLEDVKMAVPDETYQGEKVIDLGGKHVVLRELTGHTRGDQIVFLPDEQVLFTGDLVENGLFPILFDQDASAGKWTESLAHMLDLAPTMVVPGHGETGTVALLQEFRDHLMFVREEVNRRVGEGQELELIEQEGGQIVKERYPRWRNDMWVPFAIRSLYAELTKSR